MHLRNARDLLAGCLFTGSGIAFLVVAQNYPLGTAARMGPAFFPVVLAVILIGIGAATMLRAVVVPGPAIGGFAGRALAIVTASLVAFGLLVQNAGLAAAIVALVLVSASASRDSRWLAALVLAMALAAFCVLVFVKGLGLPFPILGPWLQR